MIGNMRDVVVALAVSPLAVWLGLVLALVGLVVGAVVVGRALTESKE